MYTFMEKIKRTKEIWTNSCDEPKDSIDTLIKHLKSDDDLAWSWHCNIAMPVFDTFYSELPKLSNDAAARVMRNLFDVDIKKTKYWKDLFGEVK